MTDQEKKAAKNRILNTAVSLFAVRGYASVGIREIAREADVNISMVSYYFGGKVGILGEIVETFWESYHNQIVKAMEKGCTPEEKVHAITVSMVDYVRDQRELAMVAFHTMPLEIPELAEIKRKSLTQIMESVKSLISSLGLDTEDLELFCVIGPVIMSLIITHFHLKDFQAKLFNISFNEKFYERYKKIIATLLLEGIHGLSKRPL